MPTKTTKLRKSSKLKFFTDCIGCHLFSPTTFNRILRHAGVKGV